LPDGDASETERRTALVQTLLLRHGVLVRDALKQEGLRGGFAAAYEVLRAMEDAGRVRRGYFVEGLGAAQFAAPGVEDLLRSHREPANDAEAALVLAATDPASPWGTTLPWPTRALGRPMRSQGALVVLAGDGRLLAWIARGERSVLTFFGETENGGAASAQSDAALVAAALVARLKRKRARVVLIASVDGEDPTRSQLGAALRDAGFQPTARGYLKRAPVGKGPDPADGGRPWPE
jgi:ATP-dependent Lhr-like helicase